jgi:hypothetical protein
MNMQAGTGGGQEGKDPKREIDEPGAGVSQRAAANDASSERTVSSINGM